jgi:hypothetical protein
VLVPAAAQAAPKAPALSAPKNAAAVSAMPGFSWKAAGGAAAYDFVLAADAKFSSVVDHGRVTTKNTYAVPDKTVANGTYWWRVRSIDAGDHAGRWSKARRFRQVWGAAPALYGPVAGAGVSYPSQPLILRWARVPGAWKYEVTLAADPALATPASPSLPLTMETEGTTLAVPTTLAPGRYYWAVTPADAAKHRGTRSAVRSFTWTWPTGTDTRIDDVDPSARVFDPRLSWNAVPGAARYQVEIAAATKDDGTHPFTAGSVVCCDGATTGTSLAPTKVLPNNTYYWRVRALDLDGNPGQWNTGAGSGGCLDPDTGLPCFAKTFDDISPTVPNLHLSDNHDALATGSSTGVPVVRWDPVAGAASYEVQVVHYTSGACDWTDSRGVDAQTASTAWTPLAQVSATPTPVGDAFPTKSEENVFHTLESGKAYCARVRARADRDATGAEVVSRWTQLGARVTQSAFTYTPSVAPGAPPLVTPGSAYQAVASTSPARRMPVFTWDAVPGAAAYWVVVARDPQFTTIVDVAHTYVPAYAPRDHLLPRTYADETTAYYWAVVPAANADGTGTSSDVVDNHPASFVKRSLPPTPTTPVSAALVSGQPNFRWSGVEGARSYRLQVATDSSFGNPIDDVVTDSTSFTSKATYPADARVYWRVRANDETNKGMTWSSTASFTRRLGVPRPSASNPLAAATIPALSWSTVAGATSYDMHVDQADGSSKDFTMRSAAFTPAYWYGTGVWRWQVRANFPRAVGGETHGPYFTPPQAITRKQPAPTNAKRRGTTGHALITWDPAPEAHRYQVEIARTNAFNGLVESDTTENTAYAPNLTSYGYRDGGTYFWRVATVDGLNNKGAWSTGSFRLHARLKVSAFGAPRRKVRSYVTVTVRTGGGTGVRKALVTVRGAGVRKRVHTGTNGSVLVRLRPTKKGTLVIRAARKGYSSGATKLRVR